MSRRCWWVSAVFLGAHAVVAAQVPDGAEIDALALKGDDSASVGADRRWHAFAEYGGTMDDRRDGSSRTVAHRLSLDGDWSASLADSLRATMGDRLDLNTDVQPIGLRNINTLKEAYLTWQQNARWALDAGRINLRYGSGLGYNPTDFLRDGSLRSIVSVDPASLRNNRMGSVVLRQQVLFDHGALSAVYSPKLDTESGSRTFGADLGATNHRDRWLVTATTPALPGLTPQWLVYGDEGEPVQVGANASVLFGQATIVHVEWAGGRARPMLAEMAGKDEPRHFRSRLAAGFDYTTQTKLTLSLEGEYNGLGLTREEWAGISGMPELQQQYLAWAHFDDQSPPTRRAVFASAQWQDALQVQGLDLAFLVRHNVDDRSTMAWAEVSGRFELADVGLQVQRNLGIATSEFGSAPNLWAWQLWLRHHF
jgi:hypothetical protein